MSSPSNFGSTSSTTGSRDIPEHSRRRDDHHASCPGRRVSGADRLSRARGNRDKPHLCAGFTLEQVEHSLFGFRAHALNGFDPSSPVLTTVGQPRRLDPFEEPAQLPVPAPPLRRVPGGDLVPHSDQTASGTSASYGSGSRPGVVIPIVPPG